MSFNRYIVPIICMFILLSCGDQKSRSKGFNTDDSLNKHSAIAKKATRSADFVTNDTLFDFGTLTDKEPVSHTFVFENRGKKMVVIDTVKAHCNCTSVTFEKEPVDVGKKGSVTVTYKPMMSRGAFRKSIKVILNGGGEYAEVEVKGRVRIAEM